MQPTYPINNLTTDELHIYHSITNTIIQSINANGGFIPFSRYMDLALYAPDLGYYNNGCNKFGKNGDFITAPSVSSIFAKCIATQLLQLWQWLGDNDGYGKILEIGAGDGRFMLDILLQLGDKLKVYYVLEVSHTLMLLQQRKVRENFPNLFDKVIWLSRLPANFSGIIFANELLDALPCELIKWQKGNVFQRGVSWAQDKETFIYQDQPIVDDELYAIVSELSVKHDLWANEMEFISEVNLNSRKLIQSIANSINQGFILFIDYGYGASQYYNRNRYHGTLRGFWQHHQLDEVLLYPAGLIDITASVDFSAIASAAVESNLDFIGYTTQANFLLNCGLLQIIEAANQKADGMQTAFKMSNSKYEHLKLTNEVNRLLSPNEMGDIFKVIAFSKNIEHADWLGFSAGDLSYSL